ncbi:ROK family protein [Hoyosella sp. YIM 151337]|uniref:ROK family transcriptional regulator n=1 Tax=Hoyosella sp. YIM 151337 TaxID=2992742 RepID=UPI002236BEEB|nr:ROK family protein [Hoyosella sp. YIM 151337]MCW4352384.1 ROK family protein [Hoyosella sp. YIM 151337]
MTVTPISSRHIQSAPVLVTPPRFERADSPAAAILRVAVQEGPIARERAAQLTGSSIATVNRHVSALLSAGLLRERADLSTPGAVGRPRVPFETNHEPFATLGIHIGAAVTTLVASDIRGKLLGGIRIPTPPGHQLTALASIAQSAASFTARFRRQFLWAGVALGGRVDPQSGTATHPRLDWLDAPVGEVIGEALAVPVSLSPHVEAMAAAELLFTPTQGAASAKERSSLYFYARETVGTALTLAGRVHTPNSGPGSISHFPTGSSVACPCGRSGCLEATVSDQAMIDRGIEWGVLSPDTASISELHHKARAGDSSATAILTERAEVLGGIVAMLRDLFNPDDVILGGQAFTQFPEAMPAFAQSFARTSALPGRNVLVTGFGNRVQEHAAAAVALSVLHADPLAALQKARLAHSAGAV